MSDIIQFPPLSYTDPTRKNMQTKKMNNMEENKKISVKQALKLKNVLTSELNELYSLVCSSNSSIIGNVKHYVESEVMLQVDSKLLELVELKTKIHLANAPVYGLIFMLSELKNKANYYKRICTTEGKQNDHYGNGNSEPDVYEVEFNIKQIKDLVKGIEVSINEIQEELDTFNAITII